MNLLFGNINWVHIHAKLNEGLLDIKKLAVISKTSLSKRGCYLKLLTIWIKWNYQVTWTIGTHYTKGCKFCISNFKDMAHFSETAATVGCSNLV